MKELVQVPVSYDISKIKPVSSIEGFDLHYNGIYKNHVDHFNHNIGDSSFNKAGAFLHGLYFENIREHRQNNLPTGKVDQIIKMRYGSFDRLVGAMEDQASRLQGNGWLFMNTSGYVNIIPNNRIVDNVALVIDLWEHAYLPTHGVQRNKYLNDHLSVINWDVVNKRILEPKKED